MRITRAHGLTRDTHDHTAGASSAILITMTNALTVHVQASYFAAHHGRPLVQRPRGAPLPRVRSLRFIYSYTRALRKQEFFSLVEFLKVFRRGATTLVQFLKSLTGLVPTHIKRFHAVSCGSKHLNMRKLV